MRFSFLAAVFLCVTTLLSAQDNSPAITVTLLGTAAGPVVRPQRFQTTTLIEADGERLLFDCGRGVLIRLEQAHVPSETVDKLFLTHLHSDHVVDIPDLLLTPWASRSARKVPLQVWGPAGTVSMMDHLQQAFAFDIHIRRDVDEHFSPEGIKVLAHDIEQGVVYEHNGVKVTAFLVDHGPVKPAFGYRVDFGGHSVAISGDTRPSENLVRFSKGVDLLIHETLDPDLFRAAASHMTAEQKQAIVNHHTMPEQAGEIFTRVKPKLAVFSHAENSPTIIEKVKKTYQGRVELGEDLMVITIGNNVEVQRPVSIDQSVEAEIRRLHELQRRAILDKDVATLDRIFAPEFVVTNPFGQFLNKQQTLDRVRNGDIDFTRFDRTLDYIKVYGDTVIAAGTETMLPRGKMEDAGSVIQLRITTVWIRRDGQWREVARHTSRVPAAKPPE